MYEKCEVLLVLMRREAATGLVDIDRWLLTCVVPLQFQKASGTPIEGVGSDLGSGCLQQMEHTIVKLGNDTACIFAIFQLRNRQTHAR